MGNICWQMLNINIIDIIFILFLDFIFIFFKWCNFNLSSFFILPFNLNYNLNLDPVCTTIPTYILNIYRFIYLVAKYINCDSFMINCMNWQRFVPPSWPEHRCWTIRWGMVPHTDREDQPQLLLLLLQKTVRTKQNKTKQNNCVRNIKCFIYLKIKSFRKFNTT